jgi:hypothetical protein
MPVTSVPIAVTWGRATCCDYVEDTRVGPHFRGPLFDMTIQNGHLTAWLLGEYCCFGDYGHPEFVATDLAATKVVCHEIRVRDASVSVTASFEFSVPWWMDITDRVACDDLWSSVEDAIMLYFWTGVGSSNHPDTGRGVYWFDGKIDVATIGGVVVFDRKL